MARRDSCVSGCIVASVAVALLFPGAFLWVSAPMTAPMLGGLAFIMGTTARPGDLRACLGRPRPVLLNLCGCFCLVPAAAAALGRLLGLSRGHLAGLVMVGCVNGGTGSNLLALLAGGDVALSVVMTTTSTVGAVLATPGAAKLWLGAVVPVDARGILLSALRMVLVPTGLGVASSLAAPRACRAVSAWIPLLALLFAVPLLGSTVARSAGQVWSCDAGVHGAVVGMLFAATALGHGLSGMTGGGPRERRTVAIEFAVKNVVLASVLVRDHFEDPTAQVPVAAFAFWASLVCAGMAAAWGRVPIKERGQGLEVGAWCSSYELGM